MGKSKKVKSRRKKSFDKRVEDFAGRVEKKALEYKSSAVLIIGLLLISLGLIFLLAELNVLSFSPFYILLLLGLIFIMVYFLYNSWAFLIPGVIVSLASLIFLTNTEGLLYLWPGAVSAAFLSVYFTKQKRTSWALIPGVILLGIMLVSLIEYYTSIKSWPLVLISLGLYLMYKNYKK